MYFWGYEPNSGYEKFRYIPRDDKTRDEIWNLLKDGFIAEMEGKTAEAQTVRDFWASVKPSVT